MSATTEPITNGAAARPLSPLDVLTLPQAAAYLQFPDEVVLAEATAGRLRGRRVGDDWRFVREELIRWTRPPVTPPTGGFVSDETEDEYQEFIATLARLRDEDNRLHGFGKYAPE